ncbi:accessory Sec system protein Asp3 [uncultured Limosilactobacillus sp.]|uniref:accessory Sec system protein Asp3 n=1 Tax=uncultured Limosilactobacillus sp. TaxID=2837629 RepID=UPI0025DA632F|nr:accessory Sec system protein Asp3 [uncultured Limosilactobacillus sp.]
MQKLVNHIYWSNNRTFLAGSRVSLSSRLKVKWTNSLMAPGRAIITWKSAYNYQGDKTVPQLPILRNGYRYRIYAHLSAEPASAYLIRLTFFDLQGTEIKRVEFRSREKNFVYPAETVSYQIEIINAGMTKMSFDRLDICEANLPKEVHDDVWVHRLYHDGPSKPRNIILVNDAKQSRRTYPSLVKRSFFLPVQVISFAWQSERDARKWLMQWLVQQRLGEFHLVSSDPQLDQLVWDVKQANPQCEILLATIRQEGLLDYHVWNAEPLSWQSPNIVEPNWPKIVSVMQNIWGKKVD